MTLDRETFGEKAMAIERHLRRVAQMLPEPGRALEPETATSDAIVLHLWQAVQGAIDLATALCARLALGTPAAYADAFERLARSDVIDRELTARLAAAARFRNPVVHDYDRLDLERVPQAARSGPADLRAFLAAVAGRVPA